MADGSRGRRPARFRSFTGLNTLAAANEIFIVNGEKAADRGAADLGIVTTCAPDGEGKWCGEYTKPLIGKFVRIVVDRDEKGEAHGKIVAEAITPHVREAKIVHLPGLPPKGDLWDWIAGGRHCGRSFTQSVDKTAAAVVPPRIPTTVGQPREYIPRVARPQSDLLKQCETIPATPSG